MQKNTNRSRLIAIIHAQKNVAHLTEEEYRTIVFGATGKQSCTDCSMENLKSLFADLNTVLDSKGLKRFFFKFRSQPSLIDAVLARAESVLGTEYKTRLDGICIRIKAMSISTCTQKQLRQIMGILSRIEKEKRNATAGTL